MAKRKCRLNAAGIFLAQIGLGIHEIGVYKSGDLRLEVVDTNNFEGTTCPRGEASFKSCELSSQTAEAS
jgi:hypothetical protein